MRTLLFICLSMVVSSTALANQDPVNTLNQLLSDPQAKQLAYDEGHARSAFCRHCHGEDGNSKRTHIPNLAEQNPIYLFNAFEKFANGQRYDFVMSKLAKSLTLDDRVNIALYYGEQKVITKPAAQAYVREQGQVRFEKVCQNCHGEQGEGKQDMPRLAGQPADYITQTLTNFRNKDPKRQASVMTGITASMSDEDIHAVAHYIQELEL